MKKEFEQRLKKYPLDAKYISILAKELGLKKADEYKLFSIMGREELSANLINANYRDFVHEGDFHDKYFRMNLHMHSVFSDGSLSIENYLEKGQIYADLTAKKNGDLDRIPPLTLALTDHDEIGGHSNILKILINNPEKYKNLRIVGKIKVIIFTNEKDKFYYDTFYLDKNSKTNFEINLKETTLEKLKTILITP